MRENQSKKNVKNSEDDNDLDDYADELQD